MTEALQPARRPLREFAISLLVLVALLVGAELALRSDYAFDHLPVPRPYYTFEVTRSLRWLDRLRRQRGEIDVLFVGSSAMRAAVDPARFDARYEQRTHQPLVSFNGSMSKMAPTAVRMYLEGVWLTHARPRYVLHGVRPTELITK